MEVSIFKVFFSKRKECAWLNQLGKSGHLLLKIKDSKYYFLKNDNVYSYSLEHLGFSSQSEKAEEYYRSRAENGVKPIIYDKNWVYFVHENGDFEPDKNVIRKNASYHFWKMLYYYFFALCGCVFCGYQAFSIEFLKRVGQAGDGRITTLLSMSRSTSFYTALINVLKKIGNYLIKVFNGYFSIWTDIFGEYEPIAVISVIAPITVFLIVIGSFHFEEYLAHRSDNKVCILNVKNEKEICKSDAE